MRNEKDIWKVGKRPRHLREITVAGSVTLSIATITAACGGDQ
jgi:hypothetical protein